MPFDWGEFLALARDLQGRSGPGYSEEAAHRTAVSRAYYAAFGRICSFAEHSLGFQRTGTALDHTGLVRHLQRYPNWISLARYLRRLRNWRNQCDYDPNVPELQTLVTFAVRYAERILQQLP